MARVRRSLGAPLLLLALATCARAQTPPSSDTQLWPDVSVSYRLRPDVALQFFGTVREGDDISRPVSEQLGVGVTYAVSEHLSTFAGYRFLLGHPTPSTQSVEHRYFFDVTPRAPRPAEHYRDDAAVGLLKVLPRVWRGTCDAAPAAAGARWQPTLPP
jgi:hypothetical protein